MFSFSLYKSLLLYTLTIPKYLIFFKLQMHESVNLKKYGMKNSNGLASNLGGGLVSNASISLFPYTP